MNEADLQNLNTVFFWICGGLAVLTALISAFILDIRYSGLAIWICGIALGGCFLSRGAEFLAVVQWIISTMVSISFAFYSVLLGNREKRRGYSVLIACMILVGGFVYLVWHSAKSAVMIEIARNSEMNLASIGKLLIDKHVLSLELISLTLFLVIVGAGVISRLEDNH